MKLFDLEVTLFWILRVHIQKMKGLKNTSWQRSCVAQIGTFCSPSHTVWLDTWGVYKKFWATNFLVKTVEKLMSLSSFAYCMHASITGSWVLTIYKARILRKNPLEKTFLDIKILDQRQIDDKQMNELPYTRHYNPQFVYFFPTFWSSFMYCDLWPYVWLVLKSGF